MNSELFNSKTDPIPRIRPDLDIIPIQNNEHSYLYFHDLRGYTTPDFAINRSAGAILSLLDGSKSINDLKSCLGNSISTRQLLDYVRFLDDNRLLHSSHFRAFAHQLELQYEQSSFHQSVTAGNSYPADPEELGVFLNEAFERYEKQEPVTHSDFIKALYAPHIDTRVGMKSYVKAFRQLKNITPKRVVILATSHYSGLYPDIYRGKPFIISSKNFKLPLGTIPADQRAIDRLLKKSDKTGVTNHDRAHRIEHSIELHLLFLSYLWQHEFSIIPIIIGGFDDLLYMDGSYLNHQVNRFSTLLRDQFSSDKETFFLISGDLAHTGKKFGDQHPAATMKPEVRQFDNQFLAAGESGSSDEMLQLMKRDYDPYRICGFPPLYTFLKTFPNIKGQRINYERWDETELESAVTFGSILY